MLVRRLTRCGRCAVACQSASANLPASNSKTRFWFCLAPSTRRTHRRTLAARTFSHVLVCARARAGARACVGGGTTLSSRWKSKGGKHKKGDLVGLCSGRDGMRAQGVNKEVLERAEKRMVEVRSK